MQLIDIKSNAIGRLPGFIALATVAAALLAGCAAPKDDITWNAPRQDVQPPAETTPIPPASGQEIPYTAPPETAKETATDAKSGPCREFQETITIDGKPQRAYGTACRQPDGTWKRVSRSDKPTTDQPAQSYPYQGYRDGYVVYPRYYRRYHFGFGYGRRHGGFGYGVHW